MREEMVYGIGWTHRSAVIYFLFYNFTEIRSKIGYFGPELNGCDIGHVKAHYFSNLHCFDVSAQEYLQSQNQNKNRKTKKIYLDQLPA